MTSSSQAGSFYTAIPAGLLYRRMNTIFSRFVANMVQTRYRENKYEVRNKQLECSTKEFLNPLNASATFQEVFEMSMSLLEFNCMSFCVNITGLCGKKNN